MIIELEKRLKLTAKERQILQDCEFLLTKIAELSIEIDFLERVRENAESYEYLVTGWDDENYDKDEEEEKQEDLEWYYGSAESYSNWEYITEEEYKEGTE